MWGEKMIPVVVLADVSHEVDRIVISMLFYTPALR